MMHLPHRTEQQTPPVFDPCKPSQRKEYSLINKYKRGTLAKSDLANGKYNIQQLCSTNSNGVRNWLASPTTGSTGHDFAIQLSTGFLMDNVQQVNLGAANGVGIKLYLNEVSNALFNIDPAAASLLTSDFNLQLTDVKLFGRYNFVTSPLLNSLTGVQFRKTNDLLFKKKSF